MTDILLVEWQEPGILLLTLNRPAALNAVSVELQQRLIEELDTAAIDPNTRCIVLSGAGGHAFSAGLDILDFFALDEDAYARTQREQNDWVWRLASHPKPIVAAVSGVAHGLGTVLASCADLRVGGESATFRVAAVKYGGLGLTWTLPSLIGMSHTADLLMTARLVRADEAFRIGLLNRIVADEDVLTESLSLARSIAEIPPGEVQDAKRLLREGIGGTLRTRFDAEDAAMEEAFCDLPLSKLFHDFPGSHGGAGSTN
jgi:2-(1,2-epoxy-1,2-dihydrophenyl)acetyl-CoA isomerase